MRRRQVVSRPSVSRFVSSVRTPVGVRCVCCISPAHLSRCHGGLGVVAVVDGGSPFPLPPSDQGGERKGAPSPVSLGPKGDAFPFPKGKRHPFPTYRRREKGEGRRVHPPPRGSTGPKGTQGKHKEGDRPTDRPTDGEGVKGPGRCRTVPTTTTTRGRGRSWTKDAGQTPGETRQGRDVEDRRGMEQQVRTGSDEKVGNNTWMKHGPTRPHAKGRNQHRRAARGSARRTQHPCETRNPTRRTQNERPNRCLRSSGSKRRKRRPLPTEG